MHQYLDIGSGIIIPMYNLLIGIGAIFGFLHLEKEIKKYKLDYQTDRNIYLSLIIAIGLGFSGAKVFELFYHNYDLTFYNFFTGGITFMGGIIVAGITFYITNTVFGTSNFLAFNLLVPFILISHFFGRIGCFLAGCCYGKPTNSIFGVVYPDNSLPAQHFETGIHLHPTQLYEAVFLAILFIVVIKYVKFELRIPIYLMTYGLFRFILEFYRADNRGQILTDLLTPSQILSILFIGVGLWTYKRMKNERAITLYKKYAG